MEKKFNQKYDKYVSELPKYVLNSIRVQISEKYAQDSENEFIDALFEKKYNSFLKKKEYDKKYNEKIKKSIKSDENIEELKQKLQETSKSLEELKNDHFELKVECEEVKRNLNQRDLDYEKAKSAFQILSMHHENLKLKPITPKELSEIKKKLAIKC